MINIRNITKVMLMAMFICVCSFEAKAQSREIPQGAYNPYVAFSEMLTNNYQGETKQEAARRKFGNATGTDITTGGKYVPTTRDMLADSRDAANKNLNAPSTPASNTQQNFTFCGGGTGVFSELVLTGVKIFNRLRDLIYVVAGFGIIAVSVGAFFGNLNWKWLSAIVISLLVIASAGELLALLTGCDSYGKELITNTLEAPTPSRSAK